MNSRAQPLQLHEAAFLRTDADARARLVRSLDLILDFWGMRLVSLETGQVRGEHSQGGEHSLVARFPLSPHSCRFAQEGSYCVPMMYL
jgi:hypothetical protein